MFNIILYCFDSLLISLSLYFLKWSQNRLGAKQFHLFHSTSEEQEVIKVCYLETLFLGIAQKVI